MNWINYTASIVAILGFLFGIFQYLYYNQIKFYFFVTRLFNKKKAVKFTILSKTSVKELNVRDLSKKILDKYSDSKRINNTDKTLLLNMGDFIVQIKLDDFPVEHFGDNFSVECFVTSTNYKNSLTIVDNYLSFCENIEEILNIQKWNHTLIIDYSKVKNPYLSSDIGAIKTNYIKSLLCVIDTDFLSNNVKDEVIITKEKLSFTSENKLQIYKIAKDFMII